MPAAHTWASCPSAHRAKIIKLLQAQRDAANSRGKWATTLDAAIRVLTVRPTGDRRAPTPPSAQWKLLSARLRNRESRKSALAELAREMKKAGSVEKAAKKLRVHQRTLFRVLASYPQLARMV